MMMYEESKGKGKRGWRLIPEDNDIRLLLAVGFSIVFAGTIAVGLLIPFTGGRDPKATWDVMKQILAVRLPAETGLLGSILGFYFGSKANATHAPDDDAGKNYGSGAPGQ